jgi:NTE family protein
VAGTVRSEEQNLNPAGRPRRVAIACQGGGSHTAFTAGVLKGLLREEVLQRYRVVALSGTSGGAICALLAWYGLLDEDPSLAGRLLEEFWADNSASGPYERLLNAWALWGGTLQNFFVTPTLSPYANPFSSVWMDEIRSMLLRRVDFDRLEVLPGDAEPMLLIGAVDVVSGEFRAFNSRCERISVDAILASAAIPNLFRSVHLDGGTYWDGLFSQNPPVRELVDASPDEIWVIQINPTEIDHEPRTVTEIADRRNELSGNLSLHQELHFIENIDRMLEEGLLAGEKYRPIDVRVIELSRSGVSRSLGATSKLNRDPSFIQELLAHGEGRAREFLVALAFEDAWKRDDADAVMGFFADESELVSSPPFPALAPQRGVERIRRYVQEHLMVDIALDLTRKQIAKDRVTWSVGVRRSGGSQRGPRVEGRAEAAFRGDTILSLRLGPAAPTSG